MLLEYQQVQQYDVVTIYTPIYTPADMAKAEGDRKSTSTRPLLHFTLLFVFITYISVGGVKISMVAFQAVDPGSIPGQRTHFFKLELKTLFVTSCMRC